MVWLRHGQEVAEVAVLLLARGGNVWLVLLVLLGVLVADAVVASVLAGAWEMVQVDDSGPRVRRRVAAEGRPLELALLLLAGGGLRRLSKVPARLVRLNFMCETEDQPALLPTGA